VSIAVFETNDSGQKEPPKNKSRRASEEVPGKTVNELFGQIEALNQETAGKLEYLIAICKLNTREFGEAIPYLKAACDKGFYKAYYNYGICLLNGYGVKKNENLAFNYFKRAADNGHAEAAFNCAICYLRIAKDVNSSMHYLKYSLKLSPNLAKAKQMLAVLLINRRESLNEAFPLLNNLEKKDAEAHFYIGVCHEYGLGVVVDKQRACEWYQKASSLGYEGANEKLAELASARKMSAPQAQSASLVNSHNPTSIKRLGYFTQSLALFNLADSVDSQSAYQQTRQYHATQTQNHSQQHNQKERRRCSLVTPAEHKLRSSSSFSELGILLLKA